MPPHHTKCPQVYADVRESKKEDGAVAAGGLIIERRATSKSQKRKLVFPLALSPIRNLYHLNHLLAVWTIWFSPVYWGFYEILEIRQSPSQEV